MSNSQHPAPGEGFWYLAGPYTDNPSERYEQHLEATARLIRSGITVYSPIIHYRPIALAYNMPHDADFWNELNLNMIYGSKGLIIYQLPNWKKSKGVEAEILFGQMRSLPIWGLQLQRTLLEGVVTFEWTQFF